LLLVPSAIRTIPCHIHPFVPYPSHSSMKNIISSFDHTFCLVLSILSSTLPLMHKIGKFKTLTCYFYLLFCEKCNDIFINFRAVQEISRVIKIANKSLNHLATTTNTRTSLRRAAVLAPPSLEPGKTYHSRVCCSR
jgi:hypothetical protein